MNNEIEEEPRKGDSERNTDPETRSPKGVVFMLDPVARDEQQNLTENDVPDNIITRIIDGYTVLEFNKSNIYIIENIFEDTLCDELVHLIKTLPSQKLLYSNGNNVECNLINLNKYMYSDDSLYYEFSTETTTYNSLLNNVNQKLNIYTNDLNGITEKEIHDYLNILNKKTNIIKQIIKPINDKLSFEFDSGFCLRKIFGPTRPHIDGIHLDKVFNISFIQRCAESRKINMNTPIIRNCSAVFTLNDDYEGGLFKFQYFDISIKLKKGSVIIFPPYWTHKHETTELLNKTYRYTVNTWYGEQIGDDSQM